VRALAAALLFLASACALAGGKVEVIYLGTNDCPYCRHWEAARKPELLASPEGKAASYREVHGETLRKPIEAAHYPADLKWVAEQIGPSRGVPRFVLVVDGKVVMNVMGTEAYQQAFLPALRRAVAETSSTGGGKQ
jgi:glutaredoxin